MKKIIIGLFCAISVSAFAYDLETPNVPSPLSPGTNSITPVLDARAASGFAIQVSGVGTNATVLAFVASNSLDNVTFTPDPARSFSVTAANGGFSFVTNFPAIGAGFESYSVVATSTVPVFSVVTAAKN